MSTTDSYSVDYERLARQKRALDDLIMGQIQDAAGSSQITRQPITGPDWPQRKDYQNRQQFRAACAEWRRKKEQK